MSNPPPASSLTPHVCVTGADGFIGSHIVHLLLSKNYTVTALHHPSSDPSHLLSLHPSAPHRLCLLPADLLDAPAISSAVAGCLDGVIHVASPCSLDDFPDPERQLIAPAVEGTINVLEAARAAGVRRVVVTSSISAMVPNPGWAVEWPGRAVDEDCWTDLDYCRERQVRLVFNLSNGASRVWI